MAPAHIPPGRGGFLRPPSGIRPPGLPSYPRLTQTPPMALSNEQKQQVSQWVAAGDNLSTIQGKLSSLFQVSMTYMDVRFLVDDLNLELKDPAPAVNPADLSKTQHKPAPAANAAQAGETELPAEGQEGFADEEQAMADEGVPPAPAAGGNVTVTLDRVTLIPGAMASGTCTFSDGVTAKWIVDQYGRPGFTEVSQPGYRPSAADAQAFMRELTLAIQGQGY